MVMEDNRNKQNDEQNISSSSTTGTTENRNEEQQEQKSADPRAVAAAKMAGAGNATDRAGTAVGSKGATTGTNQDGQVAI